MNAETFPCGCTIEMSSPSPGKFDFKWHRCPVHKWAEKSAEFVRWVHASGFDLSAEEQAHLDRLVRFLDGDESD